MCRFILILLGTCALLGVATWLAQEGVVRHLLQFAFVMVVILLIFTVSIRFLQWLAPTNPDGTPRT